MMSTFRMARNDWREMGQTLYMRSYRDHREHNRAPRVAHDLDGAHRVRRAASAPASLRPHGSAHDMGELAPSNVISLYGPGPGTTDGAPRPIRVVLAEGQTLIRAGYRVLLQADYLIEVVAEAATEDQAIAQAAETSPDVVLLDLGLPGLEDARATARLISHPAFTGVAVLLMTPEKWDARVLDALQ